MKVSFLKITHLVFFVLNLCISNAQQLKLGSKNSIEEFHETKDDSLKISKLLKLSDYYYEQKRIPDSIISVSKRALKLSKVTHRTKEVAQSYLKSQSYLKLSLGYLLKNDLDSAFFYNDRALKLSREINAPEITFSALIGFSNLFEKKNKLNIALQYGLKALKISEKNNNKGQMASAYFKLAKTYSFHDNNEKYKKYLEKALNIVEHKTEEVPLSIKSGIYSSMVDYFEQERFKDPQNPILKDSLLFYAEKGIRYGKSIDQAPLLAYLLGIKGKMFFIEDKLQLAKDYYNEALTYKDRVSRHTLINLYNKLAYVYIQEKNINKAIAYKDSILKDISNEPNNYRKAERFNIAYYICKTANKTKMALGYHEKMVENLNKAKDDKQIKALNELEIKYETEKKNKEIANQKLKNETIKNKAQKNYFVLGIIALLGISTISFFYFKKRNIALETELNLAKTKASLHRSQLNPHFISNSINAIYPFLYDKSDPNKAAAYLSDLSQMIRSILDSTFETTWTVKEELHFIEQYCRVQELKMDIPLQLNINCDALLQNIVIPSLITQTFIENSFVHGFASKKDEAVIGFNVTKENYGLQIQIIDNGDAVEKPKQNKISRSSSIVKQRLLNSYSKGKLQKDFLTYKTTTKGYEVIIKLPAI